MMKIFTICNFQYIITLNTLLQWEEHVARMGTLNICTGAIPELPNNHVN
jgi:hypothetical protein